MALHGAQGRPLVGVWVGVGSLSTPLSPARALPRAPPRAPPLLCGPCPVSTGPGLRGCWLARASFPLGPQAPGGHGNKGWIVPHSGPAPRPPRCPRGAPGVMLAFAAKLLGLSAGRPRNSAAGPRSPGAGSLSWTQLACHPSPTSCPKLPRWQPGSSMPAPRCLLCTLAVTSPQHVSVQPQPSPARHPLPCDARDSLSPCAHPGLPGI